LARNPARKKHPLTQNLRNNALATGYVMIPERLAGILSTVE
jgi:hypothetical protein